MITLSAYYHGDVEQADRARFDNYVADVHMPLVAGWPHLRGLRLLRNDRKVYLNEAPQYYQCIELNFDNEDDLSASLASDARAETKVQSTRDRASFADLFEGEVRHTIYAANTNSCSGAWGSPYVEVRLLHGRRCAGKRELARSIFSDGPSSGRCELAMLEGLRHLKRTGSPFMGAKPQYYHVYELAFADQNGIDTAMGSEERKATRRDAAKDRDPKTDRFYDSTV